MPDPKPVGRPPLYTVELADAVCERLVTESLIKICSEESMPSYATVMKWAATIPEFTEKYTRARDLQADYEFDEIKEISDDGSRDYIPDAEGNLRVDHDHIARSRLRVDARKWRASKLKPKKYGDRVVNEHTGKDDGPIQVQHVDELSDTELEALARAGRPAPAEPEAGED